jgi:hypothetical protein
MGQSIRIEGRAAVKAQGERVQQAPGAVNSPAW